MIDLRFTTFLGKPCIWSYDLGDSLKIIRCFDIPDNEDKTPGMSGNLRFNANGVEFYTGREYYARKFGYVSMSIPLSKPIVYGANAYYLPDDIKDGDVVDLNNLKHSNYYKRVGNNIYTLCGDPRLLGLCNFIADVLWGWGKIPYRKIKHVINRFPTRETAIRYMEHNGYIWKNPLTDEEQTYADRYEPEYQKTQYTVGDITPYLEGEFE